MERDYFEEERYLRARKKIKEIKGFYIHLFWYLMVSLIWIVILIISKDVPTFSQHGFWAMGYGFWATALFWGIGLSFHWFGVFGGNVSFSKDWEERKMKQFMEKDKQHWE